MQQYYENSSDLAKNRILAQEANSLRNNFAFFANISIVTGSIYQVEPVQGNLFYTNTSLDLFMDSNSVLSFPFRYIP